MLDQFLSNLSFIHLPIWSRRHVWKCLVFAEHVSGMKQRSAERLLASYASPTWMPAEPEIGPGDVGPLTGDYSNSWLPSNRW